MSIALLTPCPHCGQGLVLDDGRDAFLVHCDRCLDPEGEEPEERLQGRGALPEEALANYLEKAEEMGLSPACVPTSLVDFVVPTHEGYVLTSGDPEHLFIRPYRSLREAEVIHIHSAHPILYGPAAAPKAVASRAATPPPPRMPSSRP